MNRKALSEAIKTEARSLGFSLVGICPAGEMESFGIYEDWVDAGRQAEMGYLARSPQREKRADPRNVLEECKSVIVLGIAYDRPETKKGQKGHGKIGAYAWGADYHDVLKERLAELVGFIAEHSEEDFVQRSYTDTGPLLERELAQRAGLGWFGKNSMLINPKHGSTFLLAEILISLDLSADEAFEADHCGSCQRCIEACPTDCILPDRTLDAGRCISYLSIENKVEIPIDLREEMGDWIFGCDICQAVCPWNLRFAPEQGEPAFSGNSMPLLREEMQLDQASFSAMFKGRPQKRSKRRGYLRNVAVALGNGGEDESVGVLKEGLTQDAEELVRGHSAWALGQIGNEKAKQVLEDALGKEKEKAVRREIEAALNQLS